MLVGIIGVVGEVLGGPEDLDGKTVGRSVGVPVGASNVKVGLLLRY